MEIASTAGDHNRQDNQASSTFYNFLQENNSGVVHHEYKQTHSTDRVVKSVKMEEQNEPVPSTSKMIDTELSVFKAEVLSQNSQDAPSVKDVALNPEHTSPPINSFDIESFTFGSDVNSLKNNHDPYITHPVASSSRLDADSELVKRKEVELYGPDEGPKMYDIKGNLVTPPIIVKNLPEIFSYLPIFGKPDSKDDMEKFYSNKIREFVGFDLNDKQFENLEKLCSPHYLKTGKELTMPSAYPTQAVLSVFEHKEYDAEDSKLCIVKKQRQRLLNDQNNIYQKRLKYRGIRLIPLNQTESEEGGAETWDLEPGKDILLRVRIYRPFPYNMKEKQASSRHSVLSRDVVLPARARLSALRDRLACANDAGLRLDASAAPHAPPRASAKELFPSGFLFINNTFYVDARGRCADRSAPLRAWARARGLGAFPRRDLHDTRLHDLRIRLGHPEVYVHQGNCEHLFTFSEIRLLNPEDPLSGAHYPAHTAVSQNQSVYCTTCAEFGAKWIVAGCSTVPFDPAYFCEPCLKMYLYKDNEKIGDFKCYSYRGNEINVLRPQR